MKVVCIKKPPTVITTFIEVGEIFDAFELINEFGSYWHIKDKEENVIPCAIGKYFITLEEWRENQLMKIL